jgi:adenosylcobinamide-GDP ribazoletransferase
MPAASVRAAAAAVSFLTRVPLGRAVALGGADVARGAVLFPVVGAAIGAATGVTAVLLHPRLSPILAASVAVALSILLTGALHLDALADTADAVGASSRERALEIMRDSRIGSFGAAALAIDLIVKVAAVAQLVDRGGAVSALIAAGALSRGASPPLASLLPYPRAGGGPGSVLTGSVGLVGAVGAPLLAVAIAILAAGTTGAVLVGVVAASTALLGLVFRAWLGGATGDALGTVTELGETCALVVAAALA